MSIRVLHVYSGNLFGGVESVLLTLARDRELCPRMKPSFALAFEGRLSEELSALGTPAHRLDAARISRPSSVWKSRRSLQRLLHSAQFEAVVCHSSWSEAIYGPTVRKARLPLFFWLHDTVLGRNWLERWAAHTRPDGAICNSSFTSGFLRNLYPNLTSEVLHCPVDAPRRTAIDRQTVRARLGIPEDAVVIIQASRMQSWKGQKTHLRALAGIKDISGWVSLQAGGPQTDSENRYFEELKEETRRLGLEERVRFLGQRSDVPELLLASDIHFQPNEGPEPFGVAFIEALYAGLPVLTSGQGAASEIITAECGRLVPPADSAALTGALRSLVIDAELRKKLGSAGPARARRISDPATQLERLACFLGNAPERSGA
jgi:glycosyltransferase involved in cell wall biosynthesis